MAQQLNKILKGVSPSYYFNEQGIYSKYRLLKTDKEGYVELVDTDFNLMKVRWSWVVATNIKTGEETTDLVQFNQEQIEKCLRGHQKSHKGHIFRTTNLYKERGKFYV